MVRNPMVRNPMVRNPMVSNPMVRVPLVGILALSLVAAVPAQDSVKLKDGTQETGRVESENYDALVFKAKKGKEDKQLRLSWGDVVELQYGGASDYYKATNAIAIGDLAGGTQRLQALAANASLRKELKPAVSLNLGLAQLRSGKPADGAVTLAEMIKSAPNSRYLLQAARGLAECYIANGDSAAGTAAIDAAAAQATEGGVDPNAAAAFDYLRGLLLEAKKDHANAKIKYGLVASARSAPAGYTALGKLGVARCAAAAGQVDQAKKDFESLISEGTTNEVLAGAWNGKAELMLADGIKAKNMERLLDASLMFLRGVVEYAPAPGEHTIEYERAMAGAAEAFKNMAEVETDANLKKQHAARARARLEQLKKEFPHSAFSK
jgi:ATP/maltotriose-dependent transcriptional regulator MalT